MNRGRHRKPNNRYPPEVNQLQYPEIFKKCFTPEQTRLLLKRQIEAKNLPDLTVFERNFSEGTCEGGFNWSKTPENWYYWNAMLRTYYNMKNYHLSNNRI